MTPITPTPSEILVLWRLAVDGGEAWSKDVKPELKRESRDRLAAAGLIEAEKRKAPTGRGAPIHLTLADGGWAWIAANLDVELTTRSPAAVAIFSRLLRALGRYMRRADVTLAELLAPAPPAAESSPSVDGDLAARVASAYYALSGGEPNVRVRLADLRRRLADVPRETLDRQLLKLDSSGTASLYRFDDPREIGPEDREAVLSTPAGDERHIIYLEGFGS